MYDRQKTKIIATLGDPNLRKLNEDTEEIEESSTYEKGLYDINLKEITDPSLQDIVDLFFEHQVDVIRINLAHILVADVPAKFCQIKEAILAAEKRHGGRRIGVLVDLPGPKIRFNKSNWLIPLKTLRVSFDEIVEDLTLHSKEKEEEIPPDESLAQINLDKVAFSTADEAETSLDRGQRGVKRKTARAAVDQMLKAVKSKLKSIENHPDEKLLAFIGDNDCTLKVVEVDDPLRQIVCEVVSVRNSNRVVGRSKGFTIRGISTDISALTHQDKDKLLALYSVELKDVSKEGLENRILSHLGISFCQSRDDARSVLQFVIEQCIKPRLNLANGELADYLVEAPLLIAKIETEEGVKKLDEILDIVDGVMVARGDLAVEIETSDVPRKSKEIINACNLRGKPVIMATQMLESMKETIECNRPEATDVFNAVVDNVDALMLSGETSSGKYPAHAIEKMRALAKNAEKYIQDRAPAGRAFMGDVEIQAHFSQLENMRKRMERWQETWIRVMQHYSKMLVKKEIGKSEKIFIDDLGQIKHDRLQKQHSTDRITHAACLMSVDPLVKAIVAPTTSGRTARMLARFRPDVWILAQPHDQLTARKLTIDRGVEVIGILPVIKDAKEADPLIEESRRQFREARGPDVSAIFTCGTPLGRVGTTNMIQRWDPEPEPFGG